MSLFLLVVTFFSSANKLSKSIQSKAETAEFFIGWKSFSTQYDVKSEETHNWFEAVIKRSKIQFWEHYRERIVCHSINERGAHQ